MIGLAEKKSLLIASAYMPHDEEAKEHVNPNLLNRPDGSGKAAKESLEMLADTHFPGNITSENITPAVYTRCNCRDITKLISKERLLGN